MTVASHFFIATPEDAARNDGLEGGSEEYRSVFYRVMDIGIKPLYGIIAGAECPSFEPAAMSEDFTEVTFVFPPDVVTQLAELQEDQFDSVIVKWRDDDDVPYDNDGDLRDLLAALVRLARKAKNTGLNMYLWNCA